MSIKDITKDEIAILRSLAQEKYDISQKPEMKKLVRLWYDHNDLKAERPIATFERWTVQDACFRTPPLKCTTPEAQWIEGQLIADLFNYKMIGDDTPIVPEFVCGWRGWMKPFGLDANVTRTGGVGFHIDPIIGDLEEDMSKLKKSPMYYDKEGSLQWREDVNSVIGDILSVRMGNGSPGASMTNNVVHLMGTENMFLNMMTCPDLYKKALDMLSDDYVEYFRGLEERGMVSLNCNIDHLNQGSVGATTKLPSVGFDGTHVRLKDLWFYTDSQESVGLSPDQYHEFIFPYLKKMCDCFGRVSYGCCEGVDELWDKSLSTLTNLGKLSISPWCNEEKIGSYLRCSQTIYLRKPSPNFLGFDEKFNEDAFRDHVRATVEAARGCTLEFAFRDVYTICEDVNRPRRAIEIIKEECTKHIPAQI